MVTGLKNPNLFVHTNFFGILSSQSKHSHSLGVMITLTLVAVVLSLHKRAPGWVSLAGKVSHVQVTDGEADDGGLVQLAGNRPGEGKHLRQLEELKVLLTPPRTSCIARLLLPQILQAGEK